VNLAGATFHDAKLSSLRSSQADLRNESMVDIRTEGMTIDGIAVSELFAA
jgi:uncharacterized protein YjbI with pentapeptide repeats